MRTFLSCGVVTIAILALPSLAVAQDDPWNPWLGCWSRVTEGVRQGEGASRASALSPVDPANEAPADTPRACITRSGGGVTVTTTTPGAAPTTQTFLADGSPRDVADNTCRGVERREWSASGHRLYLSARITCGNEPERQVTGMSLITPRGEWLDIRGYRRDGGDMTTVTRYRRVQGTLHEGPRLTVDEVKEASQKVSGPVLEAAIAESRSRIPANKSVLVELADARVPGNVIDVIVAMAYPERFVVEAPARRTPVSTYTSSFGFYDYYNPFFGYGYYGLFYDPFLTPGYYPIYGGGGVSTGGGGGGGGGDTPARAGGRVVNGQGYTRIRPAAEAAAQPRTANPNTGTTTSTTPTFSGGTVSSGSSGGGSSDSGSSSGGSSSGGSGVSPGGFSGGDGGGRTAQPR